MLFRQSIQEDWEGIMALIAMFPGVLMQDNLPSFRSFFVAEATEEDGIDEQKESIGLIVGCAAAAVMVLEDPADPNEPRKELEIRSLAVMPGFEGRGIAKQLIALCEQRRVELGIKKGVAFVSEAAKGAFLASGYTTSVGSKDAMFKEG